MEFDVWNLTFGVDKRLVLNFKCQTRSYFCELGRFGVAPEIFDFVKLPGLRIEHVHDGVEIIHQNPFGSRRAFRMRRHGMHFLLDFLVNTVGDRFDVRIGIAFADDEKICRSIAQFAQVELDDIFTFFIPNAFDDEVIELFGVRIADLCPR